MITSATAGPRPIDDSQPSPPSYPLDPVSGEYGAGLQRAVGDQRHRHQQLGDVHILALLVRRDFREAEWKATELNTSQDAGGNGDSER